ncbi:hypothetical protein AVEN_156137-1 [Araneus ventricosus]|uniref:Uncharacterized protein n=1 Tax=Araneus ventricosus TaxID=182803 RepID=A0A4Y2WVR1_ARAVE|nr:hypothetical protein AVEN_72039-1 [Araneus ventricosus]GBO40164.1 hypothetical protein AVEN_156137-1 [Araneus ventricosus]
MASCILSTGYLGRPRSHLHHLLRAGDPGGALRDPGASGALLCPLLVAGVHWIVSLSARRAGRMLVQSDTATSHRQRPLRLHGCVCFPHDAVAAPSRRLRHRRSDWPLTGGSGRDACQHSH